jgi:hypothetical protein
MNILHNMFLNFVYSISFCCCTAHFLDRFCCAIPQILPRFGVLIEEDYCFPGCDAVYCGGRLEIFQSIHLPASTGYKMQ